MLNDPTLITNDFLAKLKRATSTKNTSKIVSKPGKQSNQSSSEEQKRRHSLKAIAIAATVMNKYKN